LFVLLQICHLRVATKYSRIFSKKLPILESFLHDSLQTHKLKNDKKPHEISIFLTNIHIKKVS